MALTFFLLGIGFVIFFLLYDYVRSKHQFEQIAQDRIITESELKKIQESEQHSQEELSMLQAKLQQTFQDPITDLLGWELFEDRLNQAIKESERYQFTMGVLFVDIDDFKVINDALSYEVGDALLKEVARRLNACIRQVDSMSRFTKDTFVVLLAQLAKPETAAVAVQRMLQSLARPFQIHGHELYITACVGVSIYPTDGKDTASLLRSADHALHLAKEKGKHAYQFYQESMHAKSQRELMVYTGLSRESLFQEFTLYYQPIMNVTNETIVCMDALLYWQHPDLGLIRSQELFNYAEKQRKLNTITEWLLRNACKQFLYWRSLGFYPEHLGVPILVNQLENTQFIYQISQILQELDFKPEWLLLEIKETLSQFSFDALEKAFNMLKHMGVKIAIDNFGSGAFSLVYLKDFPVNYLKLDSTLIKDIDQNERSVALVQSLVSLAHRMAMEVIIQDVESQQQMTALTALECTLMQGQLLGEPLSEREVADKMAMPTT